MGPLAFWAENGCPLTDSEALERRFADFAELPTSTIYVKRLFEIPWLAILVNEIPKRGSAHGYGLLQHLPNGAGEAFVAGEGHPLCLQRGTNSGHEQGFVGIDVADTHNHMRIH